MTTRRRSRPAPQLELPLPRPSEEPGVPILIRGNRRPRQPEATLPEQHVVHSTGRMRAMDMLFAPAGDE